MKTIAILIFIAIAGTTARDLPSTWKTCNRTNLDKTQYSECLNNVAREAVISLSGGLKSFKILPVEPLAVDAVKIGETQGAVTLRQEYRNIKLHGLTKGLKISDYEIDFDNLKLSSEAYNPQVDFVGDYKINGKILLLPVRGSGKCNITMYDLKTHSDIYGEKYEKNGETYMRVKKYIVKFRPGHVSMRLENLFEGDSLLGEQMNRFLNENSDLVFKELQAPYEETFGLVFSKISNDIFSRVPFDKIFPPP